jgi:hypothetical protein
MKGNILVGSGSGHTSTAKLYPICGAGQTLFRSDTDHVVFEAHTW